MSTHAGRRTFISLAIANGVLPQVVMKMTGKRTIKSLQVYIHIGDEPQEKAMNVLNKIFSDDSICQSDNKDWFSYMNVKTTLFWVTIVSFRLLPVLGQIQVPFPRDYQVLITYWLGDN